MAVQMADLICQISGNVVLSFVEPSQPHAIEMSTSTVNKKLAQT